MSAWSRTSVGTIRIVGLGDSTTAGTPAFLSPLEAPPGGSGDVRSQYAYWLMQMHPDWEILNRGINGERSDQIRARFDRDVLGVAPAVAVIVAGVNDVYQGRSVPHVLEQLCWMYRRARDAGASVVAGSILPYNTATPDQNARMHAINEWIRERGVREEGAVFADTRRALAAADNPDQLLDSPDDLHPSVDGYRRMADTLAVAIRAAIGHRVTNPQAGSA